MAIKKVITSDDIDGKSISINNNNKISVSSDLLDNFQQANISYIGNKTLKLIPSKQMVDMLTSSMFWGYHLYGRDVDGISFKMPDKLHGFNTLSYAISSISYNFNIPSFNSPEFKTIVLDNDLNLTHWNYALEKLSLARTLSKIHDSGEGLTKLSLFKNLPNRVALDFYLYEALDNARTPLSEVPISEYSYSSYMFVGEKSQYGDANLYSEMNELLRKEDGRLGFNYSPTDIRVLLLSVISNVLDVASELYKKHISDENTNIFYDDNEFTNIGNDSIKKSLKNISKSISYLNSKNQYSYVEFLERFANDLTSHSIMPPSRDPGKSDEENQEIEQLYLREEKAIYDLIEALIIRLQNNSYRTSIE